jgi:hypothetical protein
MIGKPVSQFTVWVFDSFHHDDEDAQITAFDGLDEAIAYAKACLRICRAWNDSIASKQTQDGEEGDLSMAEWVVYSTSPGKLLYGTSRDPEKAALYRYPSDAELRLVEAVRRQSDPKFACTLDIDEVRTLIRGKSGEMRTRTKTDRPISES